MAKARKHPTADDLRQLYEAATPEVRQEFWRWFYTSPHGSLIAASYSLAVEALGDAEAELTRALRRLARQDRAALRRTVALRLQTNSKLTLREIAEAETRTQGEEITEHGIKKRLQKARRLGLYPPG